MNPNWIKALRQAEKSPSDRAWSDLDRQSISIATDGVTSEDALKMAILRIGAVPGEPPKEGPVAERALEHLLQSALAGLKQGDRGHIGD